LANVAGLINQPADPKAPPTDHPPFTWEAKGLRGGSAGQLYVQKGSFQTDFGQEGQVNFPYPYASPPNVELSGSHSKTIITECTATGFKWKNSQNSKDGWSAERGAVTWIARGIKKT